ncbi:MAG: ArsR family transcriptional regulator [Actinomycetaceae bacterium]|nr:ArsR family transcriptional regulator [Actinomycetaceae bacterium]MDY6082369.1 ArsR family transcriptional regulator [Actinomycetaceae bacterium]
MELSFDERSLDVYKALGSAPRLHILNQLAREPLTATELSKRLHLSKAVLSRHLTQLKSAGLIQETDDATRHDGRKKYFSMKVDHAEIVFPRKVYLPFQSKHQEIPVGFYSDFYVEPTCGLVTSKRIIGRIDEPRSFGETARMHASLLWFNNGFVEYRIPNPLEQGLEPEMLEISAELSSEYPGSNNEWPSDITFSVNGTQVATWTCPGNFSDVRGKLTPLWWDSSFSQYGLLKHIRINRKNVGIDGEEVSRVTIRDLNLTNSPFINLRIGIEPNAVHNGGVTIFGRDFGNHPQDIVVTLYYSHADTSE